MRAEEFKQAFLQTWQDWTGDDEGHAAAIAAWQGYPAAWTAFMLGDPADNPPAGFLQAVGENLHRSVWREYFNLDCVFYQEEPDLVYGHGYPAGLDAIIEHENGEWPEEEWWKLHFWRAPLKILIFYDYDDEQKQDNVNKANLLVGKLETFPDMTRQMHDRWPGRKDDNEYLIVVGYRPVRQELPNWRWL